MAAICPVANLDAIALPRPPNALDRRAPPLVESFIEHIFTQGGFVKIRIFRVGGIFRIPLRPDCDSRYNRKSRQYEYG